MNGTWIRQAALAALLTLAPLTAAISPAPAYATDDRTPGGVCIEDMRPDRDGGGGGACNGLTGSSSNFPGTSDGGSGGGVHQGGGWCPAPELAPACKSSGTAPSDGGPIIHGPVVVSNGGDGDGGGSTDGQTRPRRRVWVPRECPAGGRLIFGQCSP